MDGWSLKSINEFTGATSSMSGIVTWANGLVARKADTAYLRLSGRGRRVVWSGSLFEAGRSLTFSAFRMGAYSRLALIRGWAVIRINTVKKNGRRARVCKKRVVR